MSQTKKGNQYYFGAKAHIGVDMDSGLVHTVEVTTAKVADIKMTEKLLHGEEKLSIGDGGYHRNDRTLGRTHESTGPKMLTPFKRKAGEDLSSETGSTAQTRSESGPHSSPCRDSAPSQTQTAA